MNSKPDQKDHSPLEAEAERSQFQCQLELQSKTLSLKKNHSSCSS
jgi:hypothetical protein